MAAPSGVVVLLMTDVEGSTRLWEERPDDMAQALRHHDDLLRRRIEEGSGHLFKTVGDAFWVAFPSAADALATAVAMQRSLHEHAWPGDLRLRVRMGLHSGTCEEREGDYFGPVVNRTARLEATAHGGQIVVSAVTAALLDGWLPDGVALRDLGEHRLRDLGRPERVYQAVVDGLPSEFPPLRSLDDPRLRHNLPQQVSSFVGREREVAELVGLVESGRLVTVVGAGGSGKSRLALQAGAELLDGSGEGVWLVELAPLTDPALVPMAVGQVLGVRSEPGRDDLSVLCEALGDRRLMLVLDNCEHLVDACARLVDRLLAACPLVHVLATSREPLGVAGESVLRLPPLTVPAPEVSGPDALMASEAVRLFVERAQAADRSFSLDAGNAPVVASICRHLDGIPLAVELAAVRLRAMSLRDIEARLGQRFRLLQGGSRAGLPHHRTLEATIDWSYELLTGAEQEFFDRLSVFALRWELEAGEAIFDQLLPDADPLSILSSLADKSLVQVDSTGSTRYELLESLRDYAHTHLAARGPDALAEAHGAHLSFYLTVAQSADAGLDTADPGDWLEHFEAQQENLRAALAWAVENDPPRALQLVGAMARYWNERGSVQEGQQWVAAALARGRRAGSPAQVARAVWASALLARGPLPATRARYQESQDLARSCGERWTEAAATLGLAWTSVQMGDYDGALAAAEARRLFAEQGNLQGESEALGTMAATALYLGQLDDVERYAAEGEAVAGRLGNRRSVGRAKALRVVAAQLRGNPQLAAALAGDALALSRQIGNRRDLAFVLEAAGGAERDCGNLAGSAALLSESLRLASGPNPDLVRVMSALFHAGAALVRAGRPAEGVALMAAEHRMADALEFRLPPGLEAFNERLWEEGLGAVGASWPDAAARCEGMGAEDVVALALQWLEALAAARADDGPGGTAR